MQSSFSSSFLSSLLLLLLFSLLAMADSAPTSAEEPKVYIVYTEKPQDEPQAYHLRTLSSVLGSDEAAKEALVYTYKNAATGFSAKITKAQADEISKLPGVLGVTPSQTLQLHSGTGRQLF